MDEITQRVAAELKAFREEKSLSMSAAGELVGVRSSVWQGWEAGVVPGAINAAKVARLLDTTVEALWGTVLPSAADLDVAPPPTVDTRAA
jgi:DNA-binding XRE family transcriptional regulator